MQRPLISFVSGTFNRLTLLQNLVTSIRADVPTGIPYEIILVDGGSTDGTLEWCQSQTDVRLIEHGELHGAIRAFTDGAKTAQGRYTVLLNDDVEIIAGTTLKALVYLEENHTCGAVAYADNRPIPPHYPLGSYHVLKMPATNNRNEYINYAQCGMFRTWLGNAVNWWRGLPEQAFTARTYAGDNLLSANLWLRGYTVDAVDGCMVNDFVHDDALREINTKGIAPESNAHADSADYYRIFPQGVPVNSEPRPEQTDKRLLRILYLPVYEPGWDIQKQQKRGLRDALAKAGIVCELDYLSIPVKDLQRELFQAMDTFQPDLLLTQIHAPEPITADMLGLLRARYPRAVVVNWNGDYWPDGLTSNRMLQLLGRVDLQLTINGSVLDTYKAHNIPAAYWQIGFEELEDAPLNAEGHEAVFLANAYSPGRKLLEKQCELLPVVFYGSGWTHSAGNTLYDFAAGKAVYQAAKIALGDNQYPDAYGFVSNRLFQALAAGGCMLLHQHVPGLEELTGLKDGVHYVGWSDFDDMADKLRYYLAADKERNAIAEAGTAFTREHHSFDARVKQLFTDLLPLAKRGVGRTQMLRFTGRLERGGVMGRRTRTHYTFTREQPLIVDMLDVPGFIASGQWEVINGN